MDNQQPIRRGRSSFAYGLRIALIVLIAMLAGCSRPFYRLQADREVDFLVKQKSNDTRWQLCDFTIQIDPRSRFYDETDPDFSPMPKDDPYSHRYMHEVDGMKGWPCWHCNGDHCELDNPAWRFLAGEYTDVTDDGAIKLNLENAVHIARINNPDYQTQLETIYLSALDVSTERFRFTTQFFGNTDTVFTHAGDVASGTGVETNTLLQDEGLQIRKHFSTGADLLIGFANSFVWQFAGPDTNSTMSLLNFNFVQPLLRAGGRQFALEQLTIVERALLANLRAFERYRQGFFTNIAIGDLGVVGPQRRGGFFGGTGLTGFTGQGTGGFGVLGQITGFGGGGSNQTQGTTGGGTGAGFAGGGAGTVGGFVGLLQQLQQVRNSRANLNAQQRTLRLLEANLNAGLIDIAQVDQFRQSIETERANLLQAIVSLENSLDNYKVQLLGYPPDVKVVLDDSMIQKFQIIDPETTVIQNKVEDFIDLLGDLPIEPSDDDMNSAINALTNLTKNVDKLFGMVGGDMRDLDAATPVRESIMKSLERKRFNEDRHKLTSGFQELEDHRQALLGELQTFESEYSTMPRGAAADKLVSLASTFLGLTQEVSLVQARARVESVTLDRLRLSPQKAISIARANRLDWMNNRAALVDTWRLIIYNATALQANVQITLDGNLGTVGNNPVNFSGTNGTMSAGLRFDAPFTRLLERNNYRSALISYQQARRQLIEYQDTIYQTLRRGLRQLDQLDENLEIQRRAVVIALRRVDQTREVINKPPDLAQPGQPAVQLGPTAAQNLLTALADLRNTQNNFMSVWLNYYSTRMAMMRELGTMQIDQSGMWVDKPIDDAVAMEEWECPIPPALPASLLKAAGIVDTLPFNNDKVKPLAPAKEHTGEDEEFD